MLEQSPSPSAAEEISFGEGVVEFEGPAAPVHELARTKRLGIGGWLAIAWLAIVVLAAIVVPMLMEAKTYGELVPLGPFEDAAHPLGLDANGYDMVLQLARGARNSLYVSLGAIAIGLMAGGALGLIAGYFRGVTDSVLTAIFNILLAIPQLVLAVALVTVLANSVRVDADGNQIPVTDTRRLMIVILALGVVSIPVLARITRANALQWSQRDFVLAARAQGSNNVRTMIREVLPNVLPAMFSIALLGVAVAIVAEGGLSILGVGVLPPQVSWGNMIALGRTELRDQPWVVFEPVAAIFLTVLSLNYLGDVIRARFDVRESVL